MLFRSISGVQVFRQVMEDAVFNRIILAVKHHHAGAVTRVGSFRFYPDCGLYIIVGVRTEAQAERMDRLISALGMSGIGGKISSGYGSFTVEERIDLCAPFDAQTEWLHDALEKRDAKHQLLLTTSLPADDELEDALEGAQYQLVRRAGYVQSDTDRKSVV